MERLQFRQGDVLVVSVEEIPAEARPVPREGGRIVLAHGEVTGHAHVLDGEAELLASDVEEMERRFLRVLEDSTIVHEEHGSIPVPAGPYEVIRQREYTPEEIRQVND